MPPGIPCQARHDCDEAHVAVQTVDANIAVPLHDWMCKSQPCELTQLHIDIWDKHG